MKPTPDENFSESYSKVPAPVPKIETENRLPYPPFYRETAGNRVKRVSERF